MATQVFGTGLGKRTLWDALDEFGTLGTVGGGAYAHASKEARMSAARGIIKMLAHGSEGEGFEVNDAVVKAAFVSLGNDGGNGPAILTTAQLLAIEALGKALARSDVAARLGVAHLGDVQNARAL